MLGHRLFNTDEGPRNCSFINIDASILISTYKFTKNRSYIDNSAYIPNSTCKSTMLYHPKDVIVEDYMDLKNSCSQFSGNNQQFKVDVESPSLSEKDAELFYRLVARLLFTSKISKPDIQACVTYIFRQNYR